MTVHPIINPDSASLAAATAGDTVQQRRERNRAAGSDRVVERFTEWCTANGQRALPSTEQTVLRYLHSHYPAWAPGNLIAVKKAINAHHRQHGYDAPCGRRTRRYINGVKAAREHETVPAVEPSVPLRLGDAETMLTVPLVVAPEPRNVQSLAQAAYDTGLPIGTLLTVATEHVTVNPSVQTAIITPGDGTAQTTVTRQQHPVTFAHLASVADQPAQSRVWRTPGQHSRRVVSLAAERHGLPNPWTTPAAYASLAPDEMDLHISVLNWESQRIRYRNDVVIVLGVLCAFRYSDIEPQRIETTMRTDYGYQLFIPYSKTDPRGAGRTVHLTHANEQAPCHPVTPCDVLCPVAALDRLLYAERIVRDRTTGWLIVRDRANRTPLITKQISNILKGRAAQAGLDPVYSSRSLRVGGATTAHEQGWPIREIADALTCHVDARQTAVYIRDSRNRRPIYLNPFDR
ncbi:MAG: hypothetical protein R2720_04440 [Candidatus Nanopelagicales bacterium]